MNKKEYRKTWYWKFTWFTTQKESFPNWISCTPVRVFGIFIGYKWKLAKPNYPWTNL